MQPYYPLKYLINNTCLLIYIALPEGWYRFGSKLLKLFPERRTWGQARQFCQSIGGDLVSINHEDENEFIFHLFDQNKIDTVG